MLLNVNEIFVGDDKSLDIDWPLSVPLVFEKDLQAKLFKEVETFY